MRFTCFPILVILASLSSGNVANVTDGHMKDSDIIKITVAKKETTKSYIPNRRQNSKLPLPMMSSSINKNMQNHITDAPASTVTAAIKDKNPDKYGNYFESSEESDLDESQIGTITNDISNSIDGLNTAGSDFVEEVANIGENSNEQLESRDDIEATDLPEVEIDEESLEDQVSDITTPNSLSDSSANGDSMEDMESTTPTEMFSSEEGTTSKKPFKEVPIALNESLVHNVTDFEKICDHSGNGRLQYVWGDAFSDIDCLGPNLQRYPSEMVDEMFQDKWKRSRQKRETSDPMYTRNLLLRGWLDSNRDFHQNNRMMKSSEKEISESPRCPGKVKKLCKSDYNTTAPMFGMSMTTGQPVAIVQKFPDLLQQVIYEVCLSDECAVVHGKCTNTYIPYLFLTIPLGPVTLTGQDYILVESGCSCNPNS